MESLRVYHFNTTLQRKAVKLNGVIGLQEAEVECLFHSVSMSALILWWAHQYVVGTLWTTQAWEFKLVKAVANYWSFNLGKNMTRLLFEDILCTYRLYLPDRLNNYFKVGLSASLIT